MINERRLVVVSLVVAGLALTGCSAPADAPPAETSQAAAPVELAADVKASIEENFPGGVTSSSPLFAVTDYEDVSPGTIRVYVQENLDDDDRDEVARHVFNMGASDNADLETVVVRDASGSDSNHYR